MPLVKKVDPQWTPSEKPDLAVGEEIEIGADVSKLVADGTVELVEGGSAPKEKTEPETGGEGKPEKVTDKMSREALDEKAKELGFNPGDFKTKKAIVMAINEAL